MARILGSLEFPVGNKSRAFHCAAQYSQPIGDDSVRIVLCAVWHRMVDEFEINLRVVNERIFVRLINAVEHRAKILNRRC